MRTSRHKTQGYMVAFSWLYIFLFFSWPSIPFLFFLTLSLSIGHSKRGTSPTMDIVYAGFTSSCSLMKEHGDPPCRSIARRGVVHIPTRCQSHAGQLWHVTPLGSASIWMPRMTLMANGRVHWHRVWQYISFCPLLTMIRSPCYWIQTWWVIFTGNTPT